MHAVVSLHHMVDQRMQHATLGLVAYLDPYRYDQHCCCPSKQVCHSIVCHRVNGVICYRGLLMPTEAVLEDYKDLVEKVKTCVFMFSINLVILQAHLHLA